MALILGSGEFCCCDYWASVNGSQLPRRKLRKKPPKICRRHPLLSAVFTHPQSLGLVGFFWKHEATSPKQEARSHQRQNNHKTHHGSHGLFLAGKSSPSKSFPRTWGPQGSSLPGCHQPGHGPGHEVLLAQARHSTASQRGFVQVGNLWREVQSTGETWMGPRRGGDCERAGREGSGEVDLTPAASSASAILHVLNILCLHLSDAKALLRDTRKAPTPPGLCKRPQIATNASLPPHPPTQGCHHQALHLPSRVPMGHMGAIPATVTHGEYFTPPTLQSIATSPQ